ncbi:MAG: site-specific integrase [Anaerolineaceae bacterium]|nr:site-specific integrase [Anaerolineaceae bacterium]
MRFLKKETKVFLLMMSSAPSCTGPNDPLNLWEATLTPHYFRHNFVTMLYRAGVDPLKAMKIPFTGNPDFCLSRRGFEAALDVLLKPFSYIDGEIHIRYNCIYGISIML